ncbi:hypothetical protein IFM89_019242 [Coptis chinensis]|uniref:Pinin/SDK/MemA protein domain-containing protein n=1 Tax=Coptis chinensis TaxID=261450 RepID=A0A835LS27_9MAGN|nr:hypothetical protein IFM89_019242 [Coptis chinensis]
MMGSSSTTTAAEKTEGELLDEIQELHRQQREITDRLRDPRGLRRGGLPANGPRNFPPNARQRAFVRPAGRVDPEDQPAPKRRLSSAVVMVKDGDATEDVADGAQDVKEKESTTEGDTRLDTEKNISSEYQQSRDFRRRDGNRGLYRKDSGRASREVTDPTLVNRNRRMLGSLLGTLEAEQRAREESDKLRQQEREKIAENRRRDLTLRARVAAKAEEKKLELLFLKWSEHHKILGNYLRTKTEPSICYMPVKPLDDDETVAEQRKEKAFLEWKNARREELSEYQKQIGEQYVANVEKELERLQNGRNMRRGNNNTINLQETMDKELETHQLEHGPKTRKIPGSAENNDDDDDVEDINVGEDDIMDDVLVADDNNRSLDVATKPEAGDASPSPDDI